MKKLLIFIGLLFIIVTLNAQKNTSLGFGAALATPGYGITVNYNFIQTDMSNLRFKLVGLQSFYEDEFIKVPFNTINFDAGYYYNIFSNKTRSLIINIGGSGTVGYELINGGVNTLENGDVILNENKLIYGLTVGVESEIFVTEKLSVFVNLDQYYFINSSIGNFNTLAAAGFKLYF